ncbi:MAG: hypothetical protein OEZ43_09380 [Gammaproteobacteria bacterium]|nr:hypothetical protein [Gammaproteobacteria bacterium]
MPKHLFFILLGLLATSVEAREAELESRYSVDQTLERYIAGLQKAGVQVFRKEVATNPITGKPEAKVVFANPFYGTRIGECHKGMRKDEPLQTLIRQNGNGEVVVFYQIPDTPVNSFGVIECGHEADNITRTLNDFAAVATH